MLTIIVKWYRFTIIVKWYRLKIIFKWYMLIITVKWYRLTIIVKWYRSTFIVKWFRLTIIVKCIKFGLYFGVNFCFCGCNFYIFNLSSCLDSYDGNGSIRRDYISFCVCILGVWYGEISDDWQAYTTGCHSSRQGQHCKVIISCSSIIYFCYKYRTFLV